MAREIALSTSFQPLASERTVGDFTIRPPSSRGVLLADDGVTEISMVDRDFVLYGVDLSQLQMRSTDGAGKVVILGAIRTV